MRMGWGGVGVQVGVDQDRSREWVEMGAHLARAPSHTRPPGPYFFFFFPPRRLPPFFAGWLLPAPPPPPAGTGGGASLIWVLAIDFTLS